MSASCQISPWLISQHSGMSLHSSQKHYLELWHLAALLPSQQNLLLLQPVQLQTQRNRAASPGMHPHSHCPVVCHSANWNRCLYEPASSTSQEEKHKPVCAARVPSDSSCKTPGAIHHCLSLLNTCALGFSIYCRKLKGSPGHTFNQFKGEVTRCSCLQPPAP